MEMIRVLQAKKKLEIVKKSLLNNYKQPKSKEENKNNLEKKKLIDDEDNIKNEIVMNQVNMQLPKNYKKDIIKNREEMLKNDEYETAKNSFYNVNENNNKVKIKKKNFGNLSSLQVDYDEYKKKKISIKKAITDNELINIITKPKINIKKYKQKKKLMMIMKIKANIFHIQLKKLKKKMILLFCLHLFYLV